MKYKVGDKVKVRDDLKVNNNYGGYVYCGNMPFFKGKTVTIEAVTDFKYDKHYLIKEDDTRYYWTDEMFEEIVEEDKDETEVEKFRAFLEEVANLDYDNYGEEYAMLSNIVKYGYDFNDYKEAIDELCDFYRTFKPTEKKKMTKAEIEDALGYKIEIVEE